MAAALFLGFRWILGVVFIAAGAMKVGDARALEESIASYGLVPGPLRRPMAVVLPVLEICLGIAFGLGILPILAGWMAMILLSGFAGAVSWNLVRGRRFECGCGTAHETEISWALVLRDLGLAALAVAVAVGPSGALAAWRGSSVLPGHAPSSSDLIAVPLIVMLVLASIRLLSANPPVWKIIERPGHEGNHSAGELSILQVNVSLNGSQREIAKEA